MSGTRSFFWSESNHIGLVQPELGFDGLLRPTDERPPVEQPLEQREYIMPIKVTAVRSAVPMQSFMVEVEDDGETGRETKPLGFNRFEQDEQSVSIPSDSSLTPKGRGKLHNTIVAFDSLLGEENWRREAVQMNALQMPDSASVENGVQNFSYALSEKQFRTIMGL
ncbi:hypothetical protein D915_001448 [Fasciola hepatica]|uniref:Uncharacterized protein n=1 Tax=Fasciola hepatica TaxID=6192 RepID=A0A4E0RK52_FASHE|nr:hypothetical protein D915_001448 [Fasciola hepatica]